MRFWLALLFRLKPQRAQYYVTVNFESNRLRIFFLPRVTLSDCVYCKIVKYVWAINVSYLVSDYFRIKLDVIVMYHH